MQNNSNHNIQGWRQRLDQFEEAVEPAEQEMLWEQFQQKQLLVPAASTKRRFYWMAAAAVISIVFCSVYFSNNESIIEIEQPVSLQPTTQPATTSDHIVEIVTKPIDSNSEKTEVAIKPFNVNDKFIIKKDTAKILPLEAPVMVVNISPVAIDSHTTITPLLTENKPKKLKLVHLNELNYPGNSTDLAAQEGKPYFPLNTPTRKVYGKGNTEPTTKDNLIRIKLFP